jgi:predicted amidophosphoribosyltransferase
MSIVLCPECSNTVSLTADACPACGFDMKQLSEEDKEFLIKETETIIEKQMQYNAQQAGLELAWIIPTIVVIIIAMGWLLSL